MGAAGRGQAEGPRAPALAPGICVPVTEDICVCGAAPTRVLKIAILIKIVIKQYSRNPSKTTIAKQNKAKLGVKEHHKF